MNCAEVNEVRLKTFMKREVVQDFLNLPGIAGVALMDGRSRPFFLGLDQTLNFQQKQALAQGIQQVIETTPSGFESFEFQFIGHNIYIYKLDQGTILLVLTNEHLDIANYLQTVSKLKIALQSDIKQAVATFRILAGSMTLPGQNYWQSSPAPIPTDSPPIATAPPKALTAPSPASNSQPVSLATPSLQELLAALNHLSQSATQYLGKTMVVNYWKSSRPNAAWLEQFQIDRAAMITFEAGSAVQQRPLDAQELQWLQEWVSAFVNRCGTVIRDFPTLVEQKVLDERQRQMLLSR